ncbi:hypothetical protein ABMA27_008829 [Loxostege sticticalis]|uniref:Ycf1 n=1 Tax=Loxostege sticticalis TaxID=481309 RepID=A0ABR3H8Y9_LOXSC
MNVEDREPTHIPTVGCLRQIKYENRKSSYYDSNEMMALWVMSTLDRYKIIIRLVSLLPLHVYYWSPEQDKSKNVHKHPFYDKMFFFFKSNPRDTSQTHKVIGKSKPNKNKELSDVDERFLKFIDSTEKEENSRMHFSVWLLYCRRPETPQSTNSVGSESYSPGETNMSSQYNLTSPSNSTIDDLDFSEL